MVGHQLGVAAPHVDLGPGPVEDAVGQLHVVEDGHDGGPRLALGLMVVVLVAGGLRGGLGRRPRHVDDEARV